MATMTPQAAPEGPETGAEMSAGEGAGIRSLSDILDALEEAGGEDHVSVRDILDEVGVRSFAPTILVPALILVSPLSGIFGLPTIGAIFIFLITAQKLAGRRHVWRPARIMTLLTIIAITLVIPFLEVLPMVTSVFAGAISLFAIGLLARDGLFTLLGYVQVAISGTLVWWLLTSTTS